MGNHGGRKTTTQQIKHILKLHSIPYYIKGKDIFVDSMEAGTKLFEKVEKVTNWSKKRLYFWLGY